MLYNHELVRKLRYGAFGLSAFFLGYSILTFRDGTIHLTRLVLVISCLAVSVLAAFLLRKPTKREFSIYFVSMALALLLLLFRVSANIALDFTLLALTIGISVGFWTQIRKKNEFA